MATIHDVAKAAKVSAATVSRVFNNSGLVSPETKAKVLSCASQLHYQPNHFSRNLRLKESRMLLVLIPEFNNPFYGNIITGMDESAQRHGYNLMLAATYSRQKRELELIRGLDNRLADGVVFMAPTINCKTMNDLARRFAVVQCTEYISNSTATHVSIDNYKAAYQAMQHLIQLGNRRIAMISATNSNVSTYEREAAYKDALINNNISFDPSLLRRGDYSFESGALHTQRLLSLDERPSAIFAVSDTVAAGCIHALHDASLRIPDDIAVFGFDNIELARMTTPTLSTVAQPLKKLGNTAIDLLVAKLNGEELNTEIFLSHDILLRKSTMK